MDQDDSAHQNTPAGGGGGLGGPLATHASAEGPEARRTDPAKLYSEGVGGTQREGTPSSPAGRGEGGSTYLSGDCVLPKVPDQVPLHHQGQLLLGQQRQRRAQQAEAQVAEGCVAEAGQGPGRAGCTRGPSPPHHQAGEGGQRARAPRTWRARTASSAAPAPQLPSRTGGTCPPAATGGAGPGPRRAACAPSSQKKLLSSGRSPVWGGGGGDSGGVGQPDSRVPGGAHPPTSLTPGDVLI